MTRSPAGVLKSLSSRRSMRPDSRTPAFEASRLVTPTAIVPKANATKQKASQPKMAIFLCCALQCAIRAERLRDSGMWFLTLAFWDAGRGSEPDVPAGGSGERRSTLALCDKEVEWGMRKLRERSDEL